MQAGQTVQIGQIVYSKCGRDKGRAFIIYRISGEYLFLVDGDAHLLDKPKKKKYKHVQITNSVSQSLKDKIESSSYLNDSDFRKELANVSRQCDTNSNLNHNYGRKPNARGREVL